MATTRAQISGWFDCGVENGHTHMIVWCDTFDFSDYPEYISATPEDAKEYVRKTNGTNMQRLMEVYDLSRDKGMQLEQYRAYNY